MAEIPLKIIDTFIFYNELDLLYYRLKTYYDLVDRFVLVEAKHTFAGHPKMLYYSENKEMFAEFADKIEHVVLDTFPHIYPNINYSNNEQWTNERFHRNSIRNGLDSMHLSNDDIVFVFDLDEFPDPRLLIHIRERKLAINTLYKLCLDFYYYNLNTKSPLEWTLPYVATYGYINTTQFTLSELRTGSAQASTIKRAGWHLSYFGDARFIQNKIQQFAHQEYNSDLYTDLTTINERICKNTDIYGRPNERFSYIDIKSNSYLPPNYDTLLRKFTDLPNIYVYIHITCITIYKQVVLEMITRMKTSGLYDAAAEIRVVLLSDQNGNAEFNELLQLPKVVLLYTGRIGEYEDATINRIDVPDDSYVLYLHSKGVSNPHSKPVRDWINLMTYYLIINWKVCTYYLAQNNNTVGVNYHTSPKPHYSGNMWWTTGKQFRCLGKLVRISYYDPEMYICREGKHVCLWESGINHYHELYPPEKYMCKSNLQIFSTP